MSLRTSIATLLILAGTVGLGWYIWHGDIARWVGSLVQQGEQQVQNLIPLAREVITPPPLRGPSEPRAAILTADGVFVLTNQQRVDNNVAKLARNTTLDQAATKKLNDMFAKQYFEHVSPSGQGPADVVESVGYSYIRVGENLALGNFASDADLVQAWMNSPGHRANILSPGFTELGVAVGQGIFEGHRTWIAVQEFGTPASKCPLPSTTLKKTIDSNQAKITSLKTELKALQAKINQALAADDQKQAHELEDSYNQKVTAINQLIAQTKQLASSYNKQVQQFNSCLQSLG